MAVSALLTPTETGAGWSLASIPLSAATCFLDNQLAVASRLRLQQNDASCFASDILSPQPVARAVTLDNENALSLVDVPQRVRARPDVDKVAKRFYQRFKRQREAFQQLVAGIEDVAQQEWFATLMLNRLMFVYFLQQQGFFAGDRDYLRNRLRQSKQANKSFYRYFLRRLFHDGLNKRSEDRDPKLKTRLGAVPYLHGDIFDIHPLEQQHPQIDIADEAFETLFDFFDQYRWHLDDRPPSENNEINPDILAYILETIINQKQQGAFYTKADITEYISKNTIIPCLFDVAAKRTDERFDPGHEVWELIQDDPDRYIHRAVGHGMFIDIHTGRRLDKPVPIPNNIRDGIKDVSKRDDWNRPAPANLALPNETWRELMARRERCQELQKGLAAGQITKISDLVTKNLEICRFAKDVIDNCENPHLLRTFYYSLAGRSDARGDGHEHPWPLSVLDPTCGSGAFLFAALNILTPLYEACLEKMDEFVHGRDRSQPRTGKDEPTSADKTRSSASTSSENDNDFRGILDDVARHPNREYFILKSIIVHNLFGVDIMPEAVEICKLRLCLKLMSVVRPLHDQDHMSLETLPDVDFNIRCGNALVGYANWDDVCHSLRRAAGSGGDHVLTNRVSDEEVASFERQAKIVDQSVWKFRHQQVEFGGDASSQTKSHLRKQLIVLTDQLDRLIAADYGISEEDDFTFLTWRKTHQPFHWCVEFCGIMAGGGFDVIIGNPPYISVSKIRGQYRVLDLRTADCPDIYAWCLERALNLLGDIGRTGMIVPLSLTFSSDFAGLRRLLFSGYAQNWFSSFGRIPSALFSYDVRVRNTIHLGSKSEQDHGHFTSRLHRWFDRERPYLFPLLSYAGFRPAAWNDIVPKSDQPKLLSALQTLLSAHPASLKDRLCTGGKSTQQPIYFKKTAYNWLAFSAAPPPCFDASGTPIPQTQMDRLWVDDATEHSRLLLLLNGKLALSIWLMLGDDFHVTKSVLGVIPAQFDWCTSQESERLQSLAAQLRHSMAAAVSYKMNAGKKVGSFNLARCRQITDQSDRIFLKLMGLDSLWDDIQLLCVKTVKTEFNEGLIFGHIE